MLGVARPSAGWPPSAWPAVLAVALLAVAATPEQQARWGEGLAWGCLLVGLAGVAIGAVQVFAPAWADGQWLASLPKDSPEHVRDQVRLYAAWVAGDWGAVKGVASRLLTVPKGDMPPLLRHGVLVYGILARMALGEKGAAQEWDQRHGANLPPQLPTGTREFLRAWDGHEPVCAQRTS